MRILACDYGIERKATNYSENKPHVLSFHKSRKRLGFSMQGYCLHAENSLNKVIVFLTIEFYTKKKNL